MAISMPVNKLAGRSLSDLWTGKKLRIKGDLLVRELAPRSSQLWCVNT